MHGEFVPIPLKFRDSPPPGTDIEVEVETRVQTRGKGGLVIKGQPAEHVLHLTNHLLTGRLFEVVSALTDGDVTYADGSSTWLKSEAVSKRIGKAKAVSRSKGLTHPASCPPDNGHSITLTVAITPLYEGEVGSVTIISEQPYTYQFSCE